MALTNQMNTALGIGIGMFRGVTNLALNQLVLGTLMMGGYLVSIGDVTPGSLMSFLVARYDIQTIKFNRIPITFYFYFLDVLIKVKLFNGHWHNYRF